MACKTVDTPHDPDGDPHADPVDSGVSTDTNAFGHPEQETDLRSPIDSAISYLSVEAERLGLSQVAAALRHALRLLRSH